MDLLEGESPDNTCDTESIYPNVEVRVLKAQYSTMHLKRMVEARKGLVIDPDFQRNDVWSARQSAELVESILMGIPIPVIYLFEMKDGTKQVVDGRQRISSILSFLNNKFRLKDLKKGHIICKINTEEATCSNPTDMDLEKNVFYLSANRLGFSEMETISPKYKVGIAGEYLFGTFDQEKSSPVNEGLLMLKDSDTLSAHINYWLTYIMGIKFEMQTEKVSQTKVKVLYKSDDLPNLSPQQLDVGVSYLVKTLIMCLRTRKGDLLMIENPELHLHPAAQARLGEFFTYIANSGIQLLLETHCEHLISKLQYQIFKNRFEHDNAVIYYKGGITKPFETIRFTAGGKFETPFPEGFFDATLDELLEIE